MELLGHGLTNRWKVFKSRTIEEGGRVLHLYLSAPLNSFIPPLYTIASLISYQWLSSTTSPTSMPTAIPLKASTSIRSLTCLQFLNRLAARCLTLYPPTGVWNDRSSLSDPRQSLITLLAMVSVVATLASRRLVFNSRLPEPVVSIAPYMTQVNDYTQPSYAGQYWPVPQDHPQPTCFPRWNSSLANPVMPVPSPAMPPTSSRKSFLLHPEESNAHQP